MADESEFDAFVVARSPGLLRTAFLLMGDEHGAEDLLQTALAKAWLVVVDRLERPACEVVGPPDR